MHSSSSKPQSSPNRQPSALPSPHSTNSFWHTSPSPLLLGHRSTRNLPQTADIVIVGSGITGTSIAHHLLEQQNERGKTSPLRIVMLEAREACWGATGRNGGHCQPLLFTHPLDPQIGHFELANFRALESLIAQRNIDCEFVSQPGVQAVYDNLALERIQDSLEKMKSSTQELLKHMSLVTDSAELEKLRVPTAKGAVVTDLAARLWPYKFVTRILEDLLQSHSSETFNLQTLTPVTKITHPSSSSSSSTEIEISTPRGNLLTQKVILATNAYTSHLLPSFSNLIVPVRGQMSALPPPASLSTLENRLQTSLGFSTSTGEEEYLIQRPSSEGGELMFGGGRSHASLPTIGTTDDNTVDPAISEYLQRKLPQVLALPSSFLKEMDKGMEREMHWTGIMGFSRDDKPWIGQIPGQNGVFVAAGFTGHGMPNAWLCGRAVAEMALEKISGREEGDGQDEESVVAKTGLPRGYLITKERIRAAMEEFRDVEIVEWEEAERGRKEERERALRNSLGRDW